MHATFASYFCQPKSRFPSLSMPHHSTGIPVQQATSTRKSKPSSSAPTSAIFIGRLHPPTQILFFVVSTFYNQRSRCFHLHVERTRRSVCNMSTHSTGDKGPQVNATSYAFLVLSTIAVVLRFCGRFVAPKSGFWWDDWLSLAALVRLPHLTLCISSSNNYRL